jgi:hypothetical protein
MRQIGLWLVAAMLLPGPALAQPQPFPDDTATQLVTAALYRYFDSASVFEVSVSGSALVGDLLVIQDLLISGKPAVLHGLRGEVLAHITGLEVDFAALSSQTIKASRVEKATVVAKSTYTEIQEALSRFSASLINPRIRFQEGSFALTAIIRRDNNLYPTVARGTLVVIDGQQVQLVLTNVTVSGSNVPADLVGSELAQINPLVDLSKYPIPLFVQRLVLHQDAVELLATSTK